MTKVSILIPVYNVEKYLENCLNSVLNQSYKNIEVICVNDGSTDNSLKILNKISKKDNRVKVFNQKNKGQGITRNQAIKESSGDYIYFLDADDYLSKDAVKTLLSNSIKNDSDIVITKIARFENKDKINYDNPGFDIENHITGVDFEDYTFNFKKIKPYVLNKSFAPWTKFYKKSFLDAHKELYFPNLDMFEDVIFHVKSLLLAKKISFEPKFLYYYRTSNQGSISNSKKNYVDIFEVCDDVENFLKEQKCFDDFLPEFLLFKILQITNNIRNADSEKYYKKTRKYFVHINKKYIQNLFYNTSYLPDYLLHHVRVVNNSKTLEGYYLNLKISELNNNLDNASKEKKKLSEEISALNQRNTSMEEKNNNLSNELTDWRNKCEEVQNEKNQVLKDFSSIQENQKVLEQQVNEWTNKYSVLDEEKNNVLSELKVSQDANSQLKKEINELGNEYSVLDEEKNNVLSELKVSQELNSQLKKENEDWDNKYELLKKNNNNLMDNFTSLEEERNTLNEKLNNLKNDTNLTILNLNKKIELNKTTINGLNDDIHDLNKINHDKDNKIEELGNDLENMKLSIKEKDKEIKKVELKMNLYKKIIKETEKECALIKEENKNLTDFKEDLLHSTSWKMTEPFRKIKHYFK